MRFVISLTFLFFVIELNSQNVGLDWVGQLAGSDVIGESLTLDDFGNIYTSGKFSGVVDFDPDTSTFNITSFSNDYDIFISKTTTSGDFVWAKRIGGNDLEGSRSIATDTSGNVYTTGFFSGTADFDPGGNSMNLTSLGRADIFVSKLDSSGNFIWAKQFMVSTTGHGNSLAIGSSGNIYVAGFFQGTCDFDPGPSILNITSTIGTSDAFVVKLNSSGSLIWVKTFGFNRQETVLGLAIDTLENVYLTGYFELTCDFDPGPGLSTLSSAGGKDAFISKLDSSGNFQWARRMGGTSLDYSTSISIDSYGNVYTTGYFQDTADFDPGANVFNLTTVGSNENTFISKLNALGSFVWAKKIGGILTARGEQIITDARGNNFTIGCFQGTADFDPNLGSFNLTSNGGGDAFILKLDSSGEFGYVKNIGGPFFDAGKSLAIDSMESVYSTGRFQDTADFNPGLGVNNLISISSNDAFIHKMKICDSYNTINLSACDSYTSPSSKYVWMMSGVYMDTIANAESCDSIITLNLTINHSDTTTDSQIACESYTWINGITYTSSNNVAKDTLSNALGCDSIITLDLTILNSSSSIDVQVACKSYMWMDGITYTSSNNTAMDTFVNAVGCDSIVTLDLTILNNSTSSIKIETCNQLISPSQKYNWSSSGIYNDTISNFAGCDSLITVDLTVYKIDTTISQTVNILSSNAVDASYQWLDCNNSFTILVGDTLQAFIAIANGDYAVEVTKNGCIDTSACVAITTIGISQNSLPYNIKIFPNPALSELNIFSNGYLIKAVSIIDITGKTYRFESSNNKYIDITELPKGIYFVKILVEGRILIRKFVKN